MNVNRIEVGVQEENALKNKIKNFLAIEAERVQTIKVFTATAQLNESELKKIAEEALTDKVLENFTINEPFTQKYRVKFDVLIEKSFLPGVTDAVGKTAKMQAEFTLGRKLAEEEKFYTSTQYLFTGNKLTREQIEKICGILGNTLIERFEVITAEEAKKGKIIGKRVPKVEGEQKIEVKEFNLQKMSDEELMQLSRERVLALNLNEMKAIKKYFESEETKNKRSAEGLPAAATDCEIEVLAQTWSEHCKHKEFNAEIAFTDVEKNETIVIDGLFKTFISGATKKISEKLDDAECNWLVSVFKDNAGVTRFNKELLFALKVETHNSPSALDPYGGALTGIVGNNRDPAGTGMGGAECWFNTFYYCFANPFYKGKLPPKTLHPRIIHDGVISGVKDGGNKCGIPTLLGGMTFDDRFMGKPLVYCGTGGLMPETIAGKPSYTKTIEPGDLAVMAGGRVGKDGIHGATMSSEERKEGTPATAVQIGDPITQKIMLDFIIEARDKGLIKAITDNGAGGLSSSLGEMAQQSNGVKVQLERVPLKYPGLKPWEIFISESQERMSLAIEKKHLQELQQLASERDVEITAIGEFNNSGYLDVEYNEKKVCLLEMKFLHYGVPKKKMSAEWRKPSFEEPEFEEPADLAKETCKVLSAPDVASKEWTLRQKDDGVKGGTIIKPLCGVYGSACAPATVIKPIELNTHEALAVAQGAFPKYADNDAYASGASAFNDAVGKIIALGGRLPQLKKDNNHYWSVCDNFCTPDSEYSERNPDGKYKLAQLVQIAKAVHDYAIAFNTPLTSGKDSMKNDAVFKDENGKETRISVPPTILITATCTIPDYRKCVTIDAKNEGDGVYVIGTAKKELGASQYYEVKGIELRGEKFVGKNAPQAGFEEARKTFEFVSECIEKELFASSIYASKGGIATALALKAIAGNLGMKIDLNKMRKTEEVTRSDFLLFTETQNRFAVTVSAKNKKKFEELAQKTKTKISEIGTITNEKEFAIIGLNGQESKTKIEELRKAYCTTFKFDLPEKGAECSE
ncbi:phosphoribosylformylglycinamidine synthase [Candidatus Micrarchaeota archaeon]|nr:phosphoribosylformylglycinamidine synthase [Candidatus Micrarchaeota archaeon]